jgi:hypothetical protein
MTDERLEALAALDFEWTPRDAQWDSNFEELCAFKSQHSHMEVPYRGKLYVWIVTQRQFRKAQKAGKTQLTNGKNVSCLTKERIQKLNSIDFEWVRS